MKTRSLIVLVALALTAACASQKSNIEEDADLEASSTIEETGSDTSAGPSEPVMNLVEAEEGFTVMMPGEPQVIRNTVTIPAGDVQTAAWTTNVDGVIYSISTADYPEKVVAARPAEVFLNEGKMGLTNQLKGTVTDEKPITLQGYPGQDYTVTSDAGTVRARNFLVGTKLYTMLVLFNPSIGAPFGEEFLTSLKLVNPPPPVPVQQRAPPADAGTPAGTP